MVRLTNCLICGETMKGNGAGIISANIRNHLSSVHPEQFQRLMELLTSYHKKEQEMFNEIMQFAGTLVDVPSYVGISRKNIAV